MSVVAAASHFLPRQLGRVPVRHAEVEVGPAPAGAEVRRVLLLHTADLLPAVVPGWLELEEDDLRRLARFRLEADARRFVTARAIVDQYARTVLGDAERELVFRRRIDAAGEHKPRLEMRSGRRSRGGALPDISIAHSGDHVLVGVCQGAGIGVDVERHDSFTGAGDPVLRMLLTAQEQARAVDARSAAELFTAKEAALKSVGWGLAIDPRDIEIRSPREVVSRDPRMGPVLVRRVQVGPDVAAAVAVAAPMRPRRPQR